MVVYRGSQDKLLAFFSTECIRNLFLYFFESLFLNCYYNQRKLGKDEEILSTQKDYFLRLSEMLDLCKLLDPSHSQIDELIQKMKEKRAEFYGCKL